MNMVESNLMLAAPPVSIRKFDDYRVKYREIYERASMYIIAKRPVPTIRVVTEEDELSSFFDTNTAVMSDKINRQQNDISNEYAVNQVKDLIKLGRMVIMEISHPASVHKVKGLYQLPESLTASELISNLSEISLEEILYCSSQGCGSFACRGEIAYFITYRVMYVGQCVGESLTERFQSHHALQKMLIHEEVVSMDSSNSDELILLPFYSDAATISFITGDAAEEEFARAVTNDFSYGIREVNLDCEKALVHSMNPKYNRIRFKKYPESADGLYNSEAETYCYVIAANMILEYDGGIVYGSGDSVYASKIIGDRVDNTVTIYSPGENYTQKYAERILHN